MKEFRRSLKMFFGFTLLLGVLYPLGITLFAQTFFSSRANGTLIETKGRIYGSELIGQFFAKPQYFHGRPSAASYDAANSSAGNHGPTNAKWLDQVKKNILSERALDNIPKDKPVPADLVLASGSGLDPHVSPEAAMVQVPRVAKARGLTEETVRNLVEKQTELPWLGVWGQTRVNVLKLNLSLDQAQIHVK